MLSHFILEGGIFIMRKIAILLLGLSVLAFLLAVVGVFIPMSFLSIVSAEALSRSSNNLAIIAIGIAVLFKAAK